MNTPINSQIGFFENFYRRLIGKPRDLNDPSIFHKLALIPLLAWVGLGADGLSSSAYGPEEVFRVLGEHRYLAVFLAIAVALTVFIISYAYSNIIEHFPNGGGGYIVATQMLGKHAGVISGSALVVDYVLTVTVSIVSCVDALFSYLPLNYVYLKIPSAIFLIVLLVILNLRGIKESISFLAPIFMIFVLSHILLISYGIFSNIGNSHIVTQAVNQNLNKDISTIGLLGIILIAIRAFSLGGGTYTGIEAVSNGLQIMREPKVKNGKRTMVYLAASLSIAAAGLIVCYLLADVNFINGKTLNAALADKLYSNWKYGGLLAVVTIVSEGALLFVAAQAGFIDAPRVMANMAIDNWLPRRFASLSDRLTMKNGIIIIGIAAILLLIYTKGSIATLVLMYSINVFLTFSISEFGMVRFFIVKRKMQKDWKTKIIIHLIGFTLCFTILNFTIYEKFLEGGWITILVTTSLVISCYLVKNHYENVGKRISSLDSKIPNLTNFKSIENIYEKKSKSDMIAVQLVDSFNGLGVNTFKLINETFPNVYSNFIFISVGLIDQSLFKGEESIDNIKNRINYNLSNYIKLANYSGFYAEYKIGIGTEVASTIENLIMEIKEEHPNITVFSGNLSFQKEKFYHNILHNQTAFVIQKKLQLKGITNVILPIQVDNI